MKTNTEIKEDNQQKQPTVSGHVETVVSAAERYFIVFFKAQNQSISQLGQQAISGVKLPHWMLIQKKIAEAAPFKATDINITNIVEVNYEDCKSYFDGE